MSPPLLFNMGETLNTKSDFSFCPWYSFLTFGKIDAILTTNRQKIPFPFIGGIFYWGNPVLSATFAV